MIVNIDGAMLRDMIRGAQLNIEINKQYVDSLNVFPVPDGDTGTNMSLTMNSSVKEIDALEDVSVANVIKAFSRGALKGARGNSGVILSQIFKGMAEIIAEAQQINVKTFARALQKGADVAYDVVTQPKEGTILTIIRVMGEHAVKISNKKYGFIEFLEKVLAKANEMLDKTPEMLPVLKQAGVVDAGGKGLIVILTGMYNILAGVEMTLIEATEPVAVMQQSALEADIHDLDNIKYAYCTEFFVINLKSTATTADIDKLRDKLSKIGDSLIVVGDLDLVKVHVHTNTPDKALGYALALGELEKPKIENMLQQNREIKKQSKKEKKPIGMMSVCSGEGLKNIFLELGVDAVIEGGQTMNPSVSDIIKAVDSVAADTVFVFPNNKNIIMVCEQAKELTENRLVVIATTEVPMGIAAAMNFNPEDTVEENTFNMQRAAESVKCLEVTHAIRDTEMDGFNVHVGDFIGLAGGIVAVGDSANSVAMETISISIDDNIATVVIYYGEMVDESEANSLMTELQKAYPDKEIMMMSGGQPHYNYFIGLE